MFDELSHIEFKDGCRMWDSGEKINLENIYGLKIPVKGNIQYVSSSDAEISNLCFFDKNMNYLSGLTYNTENKTFTTPLNCSYITLAVSSTFIYFQLEQGSTATAYEEYIEPKMYVLNNNNVYEEFIKKEELNSIAWTDTITANTGYEISGYCIKFKNRYSGYMLIKNLNSTFNGEQIEIGNFKSKSKITINGFGVSGNGADYWGIPSSFSYLYIHANTKNLLARSKSGTKYMKVFLDIIL